MLIRSGEARLVGLSRNMLYSGFNTLPRSVFWSSYLNGRSDNTDVIHLKLMFRFSIRTLLIVTAITCACVTLIAFLIATLRPLPTEHYVKYLKTDSTIYSPIDDLSAFEFGKQVYETHYEYQFIDALADCDKTPSAADESGYVPALKFDGNVLVFLKCYVSGSEGLAISEDPEFAEKLKLLDVNFEVNHIRGKIYQWKLNLWGSPPPSNGG